MKNKKNFYQIIFTVDCSTGNYKLETIIANVCFLGTYEVPRDYMEEQLMLYYDDNQFHIPEKIVFKHI